jgi:hypothetical protein
MGNCCSDYRVVSVGERAVIKDAEGNVHVIDGPKRVKLHKECSFSTLSRIFANANQYLVVTRLDGTKIHVPGPTSRFLEVGVDSELKAKDAIQLASNEVLVVYRRADKSKAGPAAAPEAASSSSKKSKKKAKEGVDADGDDADDRERLAAQLGDGSVTREIVRGPCVHVPDVDEWTHKFVWHGTDPDNKTRKIPGALKFEALRTLPDQMYYNVNDCRSLDNATITVKLMVFYELRDIERMLDRTHDPIADFINAVTADVVAFCSKLTYEDIMKKSDELNELDAYPQLVSRAKAIGFQVTKVVYRGYHATDKLQQMHDDAIQARTQLRLESETEQAAQALADMQLQREFERANKKQEMQAQESSHRNALSRTAHEEKLFQKAKEQEADLARDKATNAERLNYLRSLKELGVDVTKYLVVNGEK